MIEKRRIISNEIENLEEVLTEKDLKIMTKKMVSLREKYNLSVGLETARGLVGERDVFIQK